MESLWSVDIPIPNTMGKYIAQKRLFYTVNKDAQTIHAEGTINDLI